MATSLQLRRRRMLRRVHRVPLRRVLAVIFVSVMACMSIIPLYWMVVTAFQQPALSVTFPPKWFPSPPTMRNFNALFARSHLLQRTLNSAIVSVTITASLVFTSTLAGYAFAKKQFFGRNVLFWTYVGSMMVPGQVTLIPLYLLMNRLGLRDTYAGIILPAVASPFGVFLMKQYIQTLPSVLIDAARIDGCSEFGVFTRIVLPLARPGMAVLAIFTFVDQWNDFLWPFIITSRATMRTLPVGLALLQEEVPLDFNLLMAGATYAAVPMILVFLFFQRYFLRGITVGAVKG